MSLLMILFGAMALAVSSIQTIAHLAGSNADYVFGNAHFFGILLEGMVLWTTIMSSGTISGLLINSVAGLMIYAILEFGKKWKGGKQVHWRWSLIRNGNYGFYTTDIAPTITLASFVKSIVNSIKNSIGTIISSIKGK